ncbi:MAG TPA: YnbE family lipoprotein [Phenylobacterium sp.]
MTNPATRRSILALSGLALIASACTPTVRVEVAPITIYAKLEHDVRVRLGEDVKALIQQNPNLF